MLQRHLYEYMSTPWRAEFVVLKQICGKILNNAQTVSLNFMNFEPKKSTKHVSHTVAPLALLAEVPAETEIVTGPGDFFFWSFHHRGSGLRKRSDNKLTCVQFLDEQKHVSLGWC